MELEQSGGNAAVLVAGVVTDTASELHLEVERVLFSKRSTL